MEIERENKKKERYREREREQKRERYRERERVRGSERDRGGGGLSQWALVGCWTEADECETKGLIATSASSIPRFLTPGGGGGS